MTAKVHASDEPGVTKVNDFNAPTPRGGEPDEPDRRVRVDASPCPPTADDVPYSNLEPDEPVVTLSDGDFHHAIIVFCTSTRVPVRWKIVYALIGAAVVFLQMLASSALVSTAGFSRCDGSWQSCDDGQWCNDMSGVGFFAMCAPCGGASPSALATASTHGGAQVAEHSYATFVLSGAGPYHLSVLESETASGVRAGLPAFCQEGRGICSAECNDCFDGETFTTRSDVLFGRIYYATLFDWCMVVLCTYLVSSSVNKEMIEIRTALAMLQGRFEKLLAVKPDPTAEPGAGGGALNYRQGARAARESAHWLWMFLCIEYASLRHCCVLPLVIATVPIFSLGMGMDALNVALNSMAVLFILEVDNSIFSMVLTSKQQDYVSSVEVEVNPRYHPRSKGASIFDVFATFVAVFLPMLLNHHWTKGASLGFFPPLLEVGFASATLWVVLTATSNIYSSSTDARLSRMQKVSFTILNVVFTALHLAITYGILIWATSSD